MVIKNEHLFVWKFLKFHIFDRHHDWIYIDFFPFFVGVHLVCDVIKMLISAQHIFITFDTHHKHHLNRECVVLPPPIASFQTQAPPTLQSEKSIPD